jgi:ribonuclease Z
VPSSKLTFGDLTLQGFSLAGTETWFRVHPPGLAFEAGRGAPQVAGASDLFLSHGHLDHALGVPYVLSQRTRHQGRSTRVFCPAPTVPALESLIAAAARLERSDYDYELTGLEPGDRVDVSRDLAVEAFGTDHGVPSLGYHLVRTKRHLLERHRGLSGTEIAALRERGVETEREDEELVLSFCGDTGAGIFDLEPRVFRAGVLVLECTFLGEGRRESAERYRHIHLDHLVEARDRFENRAIVLHHLSRRYRVEELRAAVEARLPELAPRIFLLGEDRS